MSKKRTSTESSIDEQTNEDSGVYRQVDNGKRGKLASFSDTTLQDIPIEILQSILIKAITMEVKNMKLVKSVWKEKADLVISRLGSVCSQWSSVLTTDFFQIELHKVLDGIAQKIRMEILQESMVNDGYVLSVTSLKDEILMLCRHIHFQPMTFSVSWSIAIFDRNNIKKVKESIALPGIRNGSMSACNVSNCVYVLDTKEDVHSTSILRIARDEEHKFNIQTWISDLKFPISCASISVSDKGNLIIVQSPILQRSHVVSVFNASAFLLHEIKLSPEIFEFISIESNVIQKPNGNLVLALCSRKSKIVLTEINTDGIIQRQYKSSLHRPIVMDFADTSGRILIHDMVNGIELLDSELNLLEFTGPQPNDDGYEYLHGLHFNSELNEVMATFDVSRDTDSLLKIFRFREE